MAKLFPKGWAGALLCASLFLFTFPAFATIDGGYAWVRTPSAKGASTYTVLSCSGCQRSTLYQPHSWAYNGTGQYSIRFKGMAPTAAAKTGLEVTSIGQRGVLCAVTGTGTIGDDLTASVVCRKNNVAADSRFALTLWVKSGTNSTDQAFGHFLKSGTIVAGNTWVSRSGAWPEVTHYGPGDYGVIIGTLDNVNAYKTFIASSGTPGVSCSVGDWDNLPGWGTYVDILCHNAAGAAEDADVWFDMATGQWIDGAKQGVYGVTDRWGGTTDSPWLVEHAGTGSYNIVFNSGFESNVLPLVTAYAWNTSPVCSVVELDTLGAKVECVDASGNLVDASFLADVERISGNNGFSQVPKNGTNLLTVFDAGFGIICGAGAVTATQDRLLCHAPLSVGMTTDSRAIAGGGAVPNGIKSIAIDNVDATTTRVLVLDKTNVLRASTGDLTQTWPTSTNFGSLTTVLNPIDTQGNAVSLKKIIVVRTPGDTKTEILGLTTAGQIVAVVQSGANLRWGASPFPAPSATLQDISHGTYDLFMWTTNNALWYSRRGGALRTIRGLPGDLRPVAIGGPWVITNAGMTAGAYRCHGPKDSDGYYTCDGDERRVYRWSPITRQYEVFGITKTPTTERDDVLTTGNPFMYSPTIVDSEAFEGNLSSWLMWQANSRLYQVVQ